MSRRAAGSALPIRAAARGSFVVTITIRRSVVLPIRGVVDDLTASGGAAGRA